MKNILVVATGSVAVIKTKKLIDLLSSDFNIRVIASDYVQQNFVDVDKLNIEKEDKNLSSFPLHIEESKWADLIVVAPASANTLSKFNAGIADNHVLSTLIAARNKILFAPAMNTYMYKALEERKVISSLSNMGHMFIGPETGVLREGESGLGRMSEPEDIAIAVRNILSDKKKKKVVISSGASKVYLDPVRYITNGSTGTFAKLIEKELKLKGYDVQNIDIGKFTNKEFADHLKTLEFDTYISTAAFADFDTNKSNDKIKKGSIDHIELFNNLDVLTEIRNNFNDKEIIGFKLDNEKNNAIKKMTNLNLNGILWNKIGAMGSDKISGAFILKDKEIEFEDLEKYKVAKIIAEVI